MTLRWLAIVCLVAALAFTFGRWTAESPIPMAPEDSAQDLKAARDQLLKISASEYQDYLAMKASPEKAHKADELLTKIMQLFIADLGLRLNKGPSARPAVSSPADVPAMVNAAPTAAVQEEEATPAPPVRAWLAAEPAIQHARNEREAVHAVKEATIGDLFNELKRSVPLNAEQARELSGRYTGEVTFFDNSTAWKVDWTLRARADGSEIQGRNDIKLSKNGKMFSHSSGRGKIDRGLSVGGDGSAAIFVAVYGDQGYFQLYSTENDALLVGNYYQRQGLDQFKQLGTVVLKRR
ncbi:MAG: hypothetical protein KF799_06810 [Bdellovibrionales bacterium]|nr:hypothetical protein [Bdellovibrionales bacterium]